MDTGVLVVAVFIVVLVNLLVVRRLEKSWARWVKSSDRKLEDVADRAAETARLLATYHVQVTETSSRVADTLAAANELVATRLKTANINVADTLKGADQTVADTLKGADATTKPVSIEDNPVPVKIVAEESEEGK